jgi:hypothetical protein
MMRRSVLIAENGNLTASLAMSLRTLVTQSSHAGTNLMSDCDRPGHHTAARLAAARDTGPAALRLLLAAASPGARVRIGGGAR